VLDLSLPAEPKEAMSPKFHCIAPTAPFFVGPRFNAESVILESPDTRKLSGNPPA